MTKAEMTNSTTRRKVLAGIAALPVMAETAALAREAAPGLAELIEFHRIAYRRLDDAVSKRNEIEDALREERRRHPVLVPLAVLPNGECHSGFYELGPISPEEIRRGIEQTHDQLRRVHCSKWSRAMFPEFPDAMEAALQASQERAIRALAEAEAAVAAREQEAGLADAQGVVDAMEEAEFDARLRLVMHVPASTEEAQVKADYIETSPPFRDGWCEDCPDFVRAVIDRLGSIQS